MFFNYFKFIFLHCRGIRGWGGGLYGCCRIQGINAAMLTSRWVFDLSQGFDL